MSKTGKSPYDRFDLEQAIMQGWSTAETLKTFSESLNHERLTVEEVQQKIDAIVEVHSLNMQLAFYIFEQLVGEGQLDPKKSSEEE